MCVLKKALSVFSVIVSCLMIALPVGATTTTAGIHPSAVFTKDLRVGVSDPQVKLLQQFLNTHGFMVSETGVGSLGMETEYFGSRTAQALVQFQEAYKERMDGLVQEKGFVGRLTRGMMFVLSYSLIPVAQASESVSLNEMTSPSATLSANPVAAVSPPAANALFSTSLSYGMQSEDVRKLQQLLATQADIYPNGEVTGYFGVALRTAVQKFQVKYGIAIAGDAGYGIVGPKTRAKLNELFGNP